MKFRCKFVFIFILLGFLFQSGCGLFKTRDIEGIWTITIIVNGEETSYTAEFVGTRETGNVYAEEVDVWYGGGTYNVEFDTELSFYIILARRLQLNRMCLQVDLTLRIP